jgi:precorrin-8X/cobalt-precorrin-8 methylmutase
MSDLVYIKDPDAIKKKSFDTIESQVDKKLKDSKEWPIIRRVIHTTADFDFADLLYFSKDAVEAGVTAIKSGFNIVTDTKMAMEGINKNNLRIFGCDVQCFIRDPRAAKIAKVQGITRSMASMILSTEDNNNKIYALGNAPTALFKLIELINSGITKPALIIGVPVGFVGAEESKKALSELSIPYITTLGKKGGSTIAAAIVNALLHIAIEEKKHETNR